MRESVTGGLATAPLDVLERRPAAIGDIDTDAALATVSDSGMVQTLKAGEVEITATHEGISATFLLHILEPVATVQINGGPAGPVVAGATVQLSATAYGAGGVVLTGRPVTWSSGDPALATVSAGGVVQTLQKGEVAITAMVEGKSATFTLGILEAVATVEIVGAPTAPVLAGTTVQLRAVARGASGDSLPGRPVLWVTDHFVAHVSADGLVTAVRAGSGVISAVIEGKRAFFTLRVLEPVARVILTAPHPGMYETQVVPLSAALRDASDMPLTDRKITWTTSNGGADVDSAGRVTGVTAGAVVVTATAEGKSASVTLQVRPRPAAEWSQAAEWTTHQGTARHTGHVPVTADPLAFDSLWARSPLGATVLNPVTEGGGRVFLSANAYFGGQSLGALDARTGVSAWTHNFGDIHGVHPPAFGNGRVYATTSGHQDSHLYAFDAATGSVAFRSPYGNQWSRYYAPVVTADAVFMAGGYYGGMYRFNATDGAQGWFANTNQYDEFTPAVADGRVYAYTGSYSPKLQVHDAASGAVLFSVPDPGFSWDGWSLRGSPALGSMNNLLVTQGGRLISFNLQTRTIGWQRPGTFKGNVTVANRVLYVVNNGQVEARSESDGALLWVWIPPAGQQVRGTLVATNNLLFASTASRTYAIDIAGKVATWSFAGGGHLALGRDGILFIAQESGMLAAVDLK